eukprot:11206706-Lingulodinium_polyedra.AAC.1
MLGPPAGPPWVAPKGRNAANVFSPGAAAEAAAAGGGGGPLGGPRRASAQDLPEGPALTCPGL